MSYKGERVVLAGVEFFCGLVANAVAQPAASKHRVNYVLMCHHIHFFLHLLPGMLISTSMNTASDCSLSVLYFCLSVYY